MAMEEIRATFRVRQAGKEKGFLVSLDLIPKKREVATAKRVWVPEPPRPFHPSAHLRPPYLGATHHQTRSKPVTASTGAGGGGWGSVLRTEA